MYFQEDQIYHIFNQGNNRQKIFFTRENYLYFLSKIKIYVLPYADILAWCLMPNHFHLMVLVRDVELVASGGAAEAGGASEGFASSETLAGSAGAAKRRTFNQSIGILLRSYTNAINKKEKRTGSLFRKQTKAQCVTCFNGLTPSFIIADGITQNNRLIPEKQYPQVLFNYIHQNPVISGLVNHVLDWEFSSARDFAGLRKGSLVNKIVAQQIVDTSLFE